LPAEDMMLPEAGVTRRAFSSLVLVFALFFSSTAGTRAQSLQVVHSFDETTGAFPQGKLLLASDGNLYGTTFSGGTDNLGTIFRITTEGVLTSIASFNGTNGSAPLAGLVQAKDGLFYGTASGGGTNDSGSGTLFKMLANGTIVHLLTFDYQNGSNPRSALTLGADGRLYGTTFEGGTNEGYGSAFAITTNGVFTSLFSFDGANGAYPRSVLTQAKDGNFYGTTLGDSSRPRNFGTFFRLTPEGVMTTLIAFSGGNGQSPLAGPLLSEDGNLYGTTSRGGTGGSGTIFKFTLPSSFQTLASFASATNGNPQSELFQASDGSFYGTTAGQTGFGTVFRLNTNGVINTIAEFNGTNGAYPRAGLVQGRDGNLYGTASGGGKGFGTIFRIVLPLNLRIAQAGTNVVVAWPRIGETFKLQTSTEVKPDAVWTDVTATSLILGSEVVSTNAATGKSRFFRLKQ
jgi:uncharacterized repeat protein (TIGR03803 family)